MRPDRLLIAEICEAAQRIVDLTVGRTSLEIEQDRLTKDALLWNFTVLGEACGQLSEEFSHAHPHVPWSEARKMRDRIVHGYWSADFNILVTTAHDDIPTFLREAVVIRNAGEA